MRQFSILAAALLLAACASGEPVRPVTSADGQPDTRTLSGGISPISGPILARLEPIEVRDLAGGSARVLDMRRFGNGIRVTEPGGCVWTKAIDWFAPSDSFANCGTSRNWRTATGTVRQVHSIFPLRIGAAGAYHRRVVSDTGKVSERRTDCQVLDAVEVMLPSGQAVPAYVVDCYDGRVRRTTWFAPDVGPIAYREVHDQRGLRDSWVRVSLSGRA